MVKTSTIALDAFGGDHCPDVEIEAAVRAGNEGVRVLLVGDETRIREGLSRFPDPLVAPTIHHAPDVIAMDDSPSRAVRAKKQASMPVCFDLVRAGEADAVVSAGNSGAMLACGLFKFRRIKGVDRPAIVTCFPTLEDATVLLDMGANVDCKPINLVQFAVMGAVYASFEFGKTRPRVGVLSNGTEEGKGTELTRAAHRVLSAADIPALEYMGYVEGKELFKGTVDVVVTDGFTGNVVLKTAEGTASAFVEYLRASVAESPLLTKFGALLMKPAFRLIKRRADPDTYGGAPLLGVKHTAVICHGSASVRAILNGIRLADRFVRDGMTQGVRDAITANVELFAAAREAGVKSD